MEIFRYIREELELTREERERKRNIKSLKRFFETPKGRSYLATTLEDWGILVYWESGGGIAPIDNEMRVFRQIIEVDNETFIEILSRKKPEKISYKITTKRDEYDAGDLLIEVDDKIAIRTSGIIFPQASGVRGLFDDQLYELSYRRREAKLPPYPSQPWRQFVKEG